MRGQGFKKTKNGTLIYEADGIYQGVLYFQNPLRPHCTPTNFISLSLLVADIAGGKEAEGV